jgi:hypothetical protein
MKGCLIAIGIIVLVFILIVVAIVFWIRSNEGTFESMRLEIEEEVQDFSASADSWDCITEALSRMPDASGIIEGAKNEVFLSKCLVAAEYSEGFCDDIPDEGKIGIIEAGKWRIAQCGGIGSPDLKACQKLWGKVAEFCSERRNNQ